MTSLTIGTATLIHADCMDILRSLSDGEYDLAIVDPPYGIGQDGSKNKSRGKCAIPKDYKPFFGNDKYSPDTDYFMQLTRISKNQIIFGANHFADKLPCPSSPAWIVWDKNNSGDFADCELAYSSFKCAVRKFKYTWNGMLQEDMKNKEYRIHPTQKPVKLYEWLLTTYAQPGQRILDTHLGSGSSAIAANNLGFTFTGIEIDGDYFQAATARIEAAHRQEKLF